MNKWCYSGGSEAYLEGIIDVHCHLLPGVDDGAKTLEESVQMMELSYREGVRVIFATPHYRRKMFECSMEKILEQFELVKAAAKDIGKGMEVYLACEYHANIDMVEALNQKLRPTMADTAYVLTEFSYETEYQIIRERIYDLLSNGYLPVVAHAERYRCLTKVKEHISELRQMGAGIQVNASSIVGKGWSTKRFCRQLLKEDQIDYIGSDGHGVRRRPPHMAACAAYIEKKMGGDYARKILIDNPAQIIKSINT